MSSVTSSQSCRSTGSCCQAPMSTLVPEKSARNKRKFRADSPSNDPTKALPPNLLDCSNYEFSAERFEAMPGPVEAPPSGFGNALKDHPIGLKLDLELSSASVMPEAEPIRNEEEVEVNDSLEVDWSDPSQGQLEELALSNLDIIFRNAVKKISLCGYPEEVASKAVLRSGLCYGSKDIVSNIVDNALVYLRSGLEVDPGRDQCFTDLRQLGKYILIELVCVLQEVRPFFSTGDAMWCLLICDMNLSHACEMDVETLSQLGGDGVSANSSMTSPNQLRSDGKGPELQLPNPSNPIATTPCAHSSQGIEPSMAANSSVSKRESSQLLKGSEYSSSSLNAVNKSLDVAASEEKINSSKKGHNNKREYSLRQKSIHLEKHYRTYGSKSSSRSGKLNSLSGLLYDKKSKSLSDTTSKSSSLKITKAMLADLPQEDAVEGQRTSTEPSSAAVHNLGASPIVPELSNSNTVSAAHVAEGTPAASPVFAATNTELSLSLPTKSDSCPIPVSCHSEGHCFSNAGILFDRYSGQWIPQCKKDEMVMKLVPKVQAMQSQLHEWTEWANQKVMQATRRLSKDKAELKALRQEKEEVERLKKEKQALEENTMKKLSEMENALCKASGQVERANSAVKRLEVENAALRGAMEAAKLCATKSATSCNEVSKREKKTQMKLQSWEKQKNVLQEELMAEKQTMAKLAVELEQARDILNQFEARLRQESKAKADVFMQADTLQKEREQIEASAKSKEEMARSRADSNVQRHEDENQKLEKEISELRLKTDSSKYAALWKGLDGSYASRLMDYRNGLSLPQEFQVLSVSDAEAEFQETGGVGTGVKRERECVMCLSEEMSVVFMPCAHQVVCSMCNDLHEKQGMKDCPSCRCPIQRRIAVRFFGS